MIGHIALFIAALVAAAAVALSFPSRTESEAFPAAVQTFRICTDKTSHRYAAALDRRGPARRRAARDLDNPSTRCRRWRPLWRLPPPG
jgi:hypothetical protein